jgi:hypothetical protein
MDSILSTDIHYLFTKQQGTEMRAMNWWLGGHGVWLKGEGGNRAANRRDVPWSRMSVSPKVRSAKAGWGRRHCEAAVGDGSKRAPEAPGLQKKRAKAGEFAELAQRGGSGEATSQGRRSCDLVERTTAGGKWDDTGGLWVTKKSKYKDKSSVSNDSLKGREVDSPWISGDWVASQRSGANWKQP